MFSLDDLMAHERRQLNAFQARWEAAHAINPKQFPDALPTGQHGLWYEMIQDFDHERPFELPTPTSSKEAVPPSTEEGISLKAFVAEYGQMLQDFEQYWRREHTKDPKRFPLRLPSEHAGMWWEMLLDFDKSKVDVTDAIEMAPALDINTEPTPSATRRRQRQRQG